MGTSSVGTGRPGRGAKERGRRISDGPWWHSSVPIAKPSAARLAEVHLEIAEVDLAVGLVGRLVVDLVPAWRVQTGTERLTAPLVLALAIDTGVGIGQRVEAGLAILPPQYSQRP
jgi:hypothetical protein